MSVRRSSVQLGHSVRALTHCGAATDVSTRIINEPSKTATIKFVRLTHNFTTNLPLIKKELCTNNKAKSSV